MMGLFGRPRPTGRSSNGSLPATTSRSVTTSGGAPRRLVVLESPYRGDVERNVAYAKACTIDSITRGESPFLSHLLYTAVLDDGVGEERALGLELAKPFYHCAQMVVYYGDLGVSEGMRTGISLAKSIGVPVIERFLGGEWRDLLELGTGILEYEH